MNARAYNVYEILSEISDADRMALENDFMEDQSDEIKSAIFGNLGGDSLGKTMEKKFFDWAEDRLEKLAEAFPPKSEE